MAGNQDGMDALVKAVVFVFIAIIAIVIIAFCLFMLIGSTEESDMDMSGMEDEQQTGPELLTEEGENNGKDYFEQNQQRLDEKVIPLGSRYGIHWVYLESIFQQAKPDKNDPEQCEDKWVGPMKLRELNWVGKKFLEDHPSAKTDFTDCGDLSDEMRDRIQNVKTIQENGQRNVVDPCLEDQDEQQKELFCIPYGLDADDDQKANPEDEEDSILTSAALLRDYQGRYGNLGQALKQLYGENEDFLRDVKNNILDWMKDPSGNGIFRWPLSKETTENKQVSKRFQDGSADFTIKSKENQKVYAIATSYVADVGENQSCGKFVKLIHYINNGGGNLSTTYCHLKETSVKKNDDVLIGDEIGQVGTKSLVLKMTQVDNNDNPNDDPVINPEDYITAPKDVVYEEDENE